MTQVTQVTFPIVASAWVLLREWAFRQDLNEICDTCGICVSLFCDVQVAQISEATFPIVS